MAKGKQTLLEMNAAFGGVRRAELQDRVENCLLAINETVDIGSLAIAELSRVWRWAATMVYEASDNPCRARSAPKCLRDLLPKDHYLQTWRRRKVATASGAKQ